MKHKKTIKLNRITNRFISVFLSLCMITSIGSSTVADAASASSGDSSSSVVDVKPAKEYPDVERHTVAEMLANGCDEIYVPSAPEDVPNAQTAKTIADALAELTDGGVIWLTADASIDTVALMNNVTVAISSHGSTAYTVTKSGESENMLTLSDKSELTLENVVIDATDNKNGRTISVSGGSVLTLGKGAVLENNISYGAVYSDGSSVCVDGGAIRNNTAAGEAGTKEYQPSGTWTAVNTKYVFNADMGSKQALGGAILMVNESAFEMTSGELGGNTAATGGAIYAWASGNIKLYGGTVSENKAESSAENIPAAGGAICVDGGAECNVISEVIVNDTVFSQNRAKQGGAIYFGIDAGTVDFIMTGGKFIGNSSTGDGSVICSETAYCNLDISGKDTTITDNKAGNSGGIYLDNQSGAAPSSSVTIRDGVIFEDNEALRGPCLFVVNNDGVNVNIKGATFNGNHGQWGGVLYNKCSYVKFTLEDSTFKNNTADQGGGIFWQTTQYHNEFLIKGCTFEGNECGTLGGAFGGHFREGTDLMIKGCTFTGNKAVDSGGAIYGTFENCSFTIDGSSFVNNVSGESGGGFMAYIADATVTVTGESLFRGNSADVNAGAFSVRRNNKERPGTVYLLSADIIDNVCNADFSRYEADDLEPTKHYNTGGVYIGENIVLKTYDIEITQNQVKSGYEGNMIGTGIGVCPHGTVILNPEHGAKIHNNGDGNGMDILAVPWDEVIDHEVPSQLYIPEKTPDGKDYNWTDLNGDEARTGLYSWNEVLKEKEDAEQGISTVSLMAESDGYTGEKSLDPVGFRANIDEPRFKTMAANSTTEPKVYIAGNSSDSALYGGGGVMVNGTVIAGDLEVSVEKKTEGLSEEDKKTKEFEFEFSITYKSSSYTEESAMKSGFKTEGDVEIDFKKTGGEITGEETGKITLKKSATEESGAFYPTLSCTFKLKSDEKITFSNFKDTSGYSIFYNDSYSENPYYFELKEIDSGGAESVEITKKVAGTEVTGDIFDPDHNYSTGTVNKIEFTCTNTFKGSLTVTKVLEGDYASAKNKTFTFTVTGPSYPNGEKVEITGANSETLNNLLPGMYTVVEENAEIKGYKLKTKMNPENGVVDVTGGNEVTVTVTNTYNIEPTEYAPQIEKTVKGNAPSDETFTFNIKASEDNPIGAELPTDTTATVKGAGTVSFGNITFSKVGTYKFEIREIAGESLGCTYDESVWTLTVKVENVDSALTVTSHTYTKAGVQPNENNASFENIYFRPVNFTPKAIKMLTGAIPPSEGTFSFSIKEKADNPSGAVLPEDTTATVKGAGSTNFGDITFTKAGTYNFEIKETKGSEAGYIYDESVWTLTVEVEDNDSQLEVTNYSYAKIGVLDNTTGAEFTNIYRTNSTTYTPQVSKTITGSTPSSESTFIFNITASSDNPDGAELPTDTSATVTGSGSTNFGNIKFTKAGTYDFEIKETKGNDSGYTYDESVWTLTVVVVDNESQLEVESYSYTKADGTTSNDGAAFTNTYNVSPTEFTPKINKTVKGDTPSDKTFTFNITASEENPDGAVLPENTTATVTGSGTASFGNITFSKAGIYNFEIKETKGNDSGYTYDESVWTLTVVVVDNNSQLEVESHSYTKADGTTSNDGAAFTNTYNVSPTEFTPKVKKTVKGDTPSDKTFTFNITASENNPSGAELPTDTSATVTGSGTTSFDNIKFTKAGTYNFEIKEDQGNEPGYSYDGSIWTLAVEVTDENSQLKVSKAEYTKDGAQSSDEASFENSYSTTEVSYSPQVTKEITGDKTPSDKTFTFNIEASENNPSGAEMPEDKTATVKGAGNTNFNAITFTKAGTYTFKISEAKGNDAGYAYDESVWTLKVKVVDNESKLEVQSHTYTKTDGTANEDKSEFENIYSSGSLTISKVVTGDAGDKNKEFTFTVTFTDVNGNPLDGEYSYTGSKEGTIKSGEEVRLKDGESITISGLPIGTKYTVVEAEANKDGYTTTSKGESGEISEKEQKAEFTNSKNTDPTKPTVPTNPTNPTSSTNPTNPTKPTESKKTTTTKRTSSNPPYSKSQNNENTKGGNNGNTPNTGSESDRNLPIAFLVTFLLGLNSVYFSFRRRKIKGRKAK